MNYLLHRQKVRGEVIKMPDGLQELMADISREVLRCQPPADCLYRFIANYLHALVETREKANVAKSTIDEALLRVDEVIEFMQECNIPADKSKVMAQLMEESFRKFLEKKRCHQYKASKDLIEFHAEDMLDELIRKCKFTEKEVLRSRPVIQSAYKMFVKAYVEAIEGTLDTEALYQYFEEQDRIKRNKDAMHKAAVAIQSVYRGFRTRQMLRSKNLYGGITAISLLDFRQTELEKMNKAATKIQSVYKGFCARKRFTSFSSEHKKSQSFSYNCNNRQFSNTFKSIRTTQSERIFDASSFEVDRSSNISHTDGSIASETSENVGVKFIENPTGASAIDSLTEVELVNKDLDDVTEKIMEETEPI